MALPVIKIDSNGGSDTQASGAGPDTAIYGSTGVSAANGLSVDLSADAPDLSGVATDGSAVLFFDDTVNYVRSFSKITGVDNNTKIVTVANAFGGSLTRAWAIGGRRAALLSTPTGKLASEAASPGDAMPGWIIELQSGHSETNSNGIVFRRPGNQTDGPITLRGAPGAAVLPLITNTANQSCIVAQSQFLRFEGFELRNSAASKTSSSAISVTAQYVVVRGVKVSHPVDYFYRCMNASASGTLFLDCDLGYAASVGIDIGSAYHCVVMNCFIHNAGSYGISNNTFGTRIIGNILYSNGGDGICNSATGTTSNSPLLIIGNVIVSNTGSGIRIASTSTQLSGFYAHVLSNDFSNNGGYGINFSGSGVTDDVLRGGHFFALNNNHYANTSDAGHLVNLGTLTNESDTTNINPAYADAAGGDFSSTALTEKGYPLGGTLRVGGYSQTYSYPDIGVQAHVTG